MVLAKAGVIETGKIERHKPIIRDTGRILCLIWLLFNDRYNYCRTGLITPGAFRLKPYLVLHASSEIGHFEQSAFKLLASANIF